MTTTFDAAALSQRLRSGPEQVIGWVDAPSRTATLTTARDDGGWDETSFVQLAQRVRAISTSLRTELAAGGHGADTPVAVLATTSVEAVAAYCAVLDSGAALVPLSPPGMGEQQLAIERISRICSSAQAPLIICDSGQQEVAAAAAGSSRVIDIATLEQAGSAATITAQQATWPRGDIAFVQFTSGSTGNPRGVPISWDALAANCQMIAAHIGWQPGDRFGGWIPMYHDMGLVGVVMTALITQSSLELMRPDQFIRAPHRWVEMLARVQHTAAPSFGLGYLAHRLRRTSEAVADLDVSGCTSIVIGSEPLSATDISTFAELMLPLGLSPTAIRPAYGLAEATVMACATWPDTELAAVTLARPPQLGKPVEVAQRWHGDLRNLPRPGAETWHFALGTADSDVIMRIVDHYGAALPEGALGELVIEGPSVAPNYYRPAQVDPASQRTRFANGTLYTGDAAFFLDGQLYVLGRMATSLKVRGRTVFMEDIDAAIVRASGLPGGRVAATAVLDGALSQILVALEDPSAEQEEQAAQAARAVAGPEVKVSTLAVPRGTIPRTSSGKPQRGALGAMVPLAASDGTQRTPKTGSSPGSGIPQRNAEPEVCELFAAIEQQVSLPPGAAVLHEGSLAEGFGNPGSDIDFLIIVPGTADTPTMPTVLFAAGRRIEVRTRSVGQVNAQWRALSDAAELAGGADPDTPSEDLLNRCQRLAAARIVRHGVALHEIETMSPAQLGQLLSHWWTARARGCRARAVAAQACGVVAAAEAWWQAAGLQYLKAWLAAHGETYLESKWTDAQLERAARHHTVPVQHLPESPSQWMTLCSALDTTPPPTTAQLVVLRAADVTSWTIGGREHIVRDRAVVFLAPGATGAAWRRMVPGRSLAANLPGDPTKGAVLHAALELGLVRLGLPDTAGVVQPVIPAMAMVSAAAAVTPPAVPVSPVLTLAGATEPHGTASEAPLPFVRSPLTAPEFASAGMALVWALMVAENALEDLHGALSAEQWGVASAAARRLVLLCARMELVINGVWPLPSDVHPGLSLRQLCPPGAHTEELATEIDALLGSASSPAAVAEDAAAILRRLDTLHKAARQRVSGTQFPSSFAGQSEWTETLTIAYDWLRLGGYLDASLPLDEARDLVESGGAQPHIARSTTTGGHDEH